jgi:hypothetical protein
VRDGNIGGQQPLLLNFNHPAPAGQRRGLSVGDILLVVAAFIAAPAFACLLIFERNRRFQAVTTPSVDNDCARWQKCGNPLFFPRRTFDGGRTDIVGQTWRRKINGRWQYKQDEETAQEYEDRAYGSF